MDNLTHCMTGVLLSRAGLNRLAPQAGWLLLLAANAPDIDVVSFAGGNPLYLEVHRGWTHAFAFIPLVALLPLPIWAWLTRGRRRPWGAAFGLSCAGVLSHLLLDWTNVYGVRLLEPFSRRWLRLDLFYIIDLWVWIALFLGVSLPLLSRLVSAELGARKGSGRGAAWTALLLVVLYAGLRWQLHERALAVLESRVYAGAAPRTSAAFPTPVNPFLWRGLVETGDAYRLFELNLNADFDPDAGRVLYRSDATEEIAIATATRAGRAFAAFTQFPWWSVTPAGQPEGALQVSAVDLRFGPPEEHRFRLAVLLGPAGQVLAESFAFGTLERSGR